MAPELESTLPRLDCEVVGPWGTMGTDPALSGAVAQIPYANPHSKRLNAPFVADAGKLTFSHEARFHRFTRLVPREDRIWTVQQVLVTANGASDWMLEGDVDLTEPTAADGPLVWLRRIAV